MCKRAPYKTLANKTTGRVIGFRPDCMNWSCHDCRPRLEAIWREHFGRCFEGGPVGLTTVPAEIADRFAAKCRRAGCRYIRVRGHGIVHFYLQDPGRGERCLPRDAAAQRFAEHLSLAPTKQGHPVSTSRAWKLLAEYRQTEGFEVVAVGVSKLEVQRLLRELDQRFERRVFKREFLIATLPEPTLDRFLRLLSVAKRERPCFYKEEPGSEPLRGKKYRNTTQRPSGVSQGDVDHSKEAFACLRAAMF